MNTTKKAKLSRTAKEIGARISINRKGDVALYFIIIGAILFAISFLIYMGRMDKNLQTIGENTVKVVNTFEMSERILFYIDTSTEIAEKSARMQVIDDSGYLKEIYKGKIQNSGCGTLAYPIIDSEKIRNSPNGINECFPNYENEFKILFTRNLNAMLIKYAPFEINPETFGINVKRTQKGMNIELFSISDMDFPVYAYIESYYRDADKTRTSKDTSAEIQRNDDGYFSIKAYSVLSSFSREGITPSRIVIHDTNTETVQETFSELKTGIRNYNYVIDSNGDIYQFADESRKTKHSSCTKGGTVNTCLIEGTDDDSISVALVHKFSYYSHTKKQLNALSNLLADISARNPTIQLDEASILLNSEIDSSRSLDPGYDIAAQKKTIITKADGVKQQIVIQPKYDVQGTLLNAWWREEETDTSNPQSNSLVSLTGNAIKISQPDIDEANCFSNVKTTIYYTPNSKDKSLWSTHAKSCPNSLGFCCIPKEERGFYEEVMCQGSGVANGQVYHYTKINPAGLTQSIPVPDNKNGITSIGRDPMPKRTVAADPNCPGFAYNSKLYIYWGENNPWNGYYIVEDTGSAFTGRCDKMDIYAGTGEASLKEASKYVGQSAKVCILDKNFEMPDPDFSGSSSFIDPGKGEYSVSYKHEVESNDIVSLFEGTKKMLDEIINKCSGASSIAEREICTAKAMTSSEKYGIKMKLCDAAVQDKIWTAEEISADIPLIVTQYERNYKFFGTVTAVNVNNVDLFSAYNPASNAKQGFVSAFTKSPTNVVITVADNSGQELKINLEEGALEWVDYINKDSALYENDLFIRTGSKVLLNITKIKNSTHDGIYATKFEHITDYPKDLLEDEMIKTAKTLAECATSNAECICTTGPTQYLGLVNLTGNEMYSVLKEQSRINLPFMASESVVVNSAYPKKWVVNTAKIREANLADEAVLGVCSPTKKYIYVCSSLKDNEAFGTIGYALKI